MKIRKQRGKIKTTTSKIAKLAKGIGGLADKAGIDLTPGNLTTGMTSDGKMNFLEFMALPPGPPPIPRDQWVKRLVYASGTIRKEGSKIVVEFNDSRDNKKCKSMKQAWKIIQREERLLNKKTKVKKDEEEKVE